MSDADDDDALMGRYRLGDAEAFDRLYERHRGPLYRFILHQCGDRALVDELFQDVWTTVIEARDRYRPESHFRAWLFTLARNRVIDHYRRADHPAAAMFMSDEDLPEQAAHRTDEPHVRAESNAQAASVAGILADMPAGQREAFLLYEEGGLSIDEIARCTGVTFEGAKSRLRYAVARLRAGLAPWRERDERDFSQKR
jgi:RNA polymerase sigma-70 factor, ECF subfamily